MGPMATLVLREHIVTLGESSESFPEAKIEELTKRVSEEISDDSPGALREGDVERDPEAWRTLSKEEGVGVGSRE
jgi:hypothetical protein